MEGRSQNFFEDKFPIQDLAPEIHVVSNQLLRAFDGGNMRKASSYTGIFSREQVGSRKTFSKISSPIRGLAPEIYVVSDQLLRAFNGGNMRKASSYTGMFSREQVASRKTFSKISSPIRGLTPEIYVVSDQLLRAFNGGNMKKASSCTAMSSREQVGSSLGTRAKLLCEHSKRKHVRLVNALKDAVDKRQPGISKEEMLANALRGIYPSCVPFGYRNNADGTIEVCPVESRIVTRIFDLCASGNHCMKSIAKASLDDFGISVTDATIYAILHDCFYLGVFEWEKRWYCGIHPTFLRPGVFYEAHTILNECDQTGSDTDLGPVPGYIPKEEIMTDKLTSNLDSSPRCAIYARCAASKSDRSRSRDSSKVAGQRPLETAGLSLRTTSTQT
jgi:hypothetical protein